MNLHNKRWAIIAKSAFMAGTAILLAGATSAAEQQVQLTPVTHTSNGDVQGVAAWIHPSLRQIEIGGVVAQPEEAPHPSTR